MKIRSFDDFIKEEEGQIVKTTENFEEFSDNRLKGASDITKKAEEKGGDALLTYHHFNVKLPYYEAAKAGKFDSNTAFVEYTDFLNQLVSGSQGKITIGQVEFQELVGKLEVLGELLIKNNDK